MQALVLNAGAAKIRLAQRFGAGLAAPGVTVWRRQWNLDNVLDKSLPQGSGLAKPLMLAFIALLASAHLRASRRHPRHLAQARPPARTREDCWEDWVDCSKSSNRAVMVR